jgi:hypothetical protein
MKEKFTPAEWQELKMLPLIVYRDVAYADRNVDERETAELFRSLNTALWVRVNPMLKELIRDIILSDFGELTIAAIRAGPDDLQRIKGFLQEKLTTDEYQAFLEDIFQQAVGVARAEGRAKLRRRHSNPSHPRSRSIPKP